MSSVIAIGRQHVLVSNSRATSLVELAIDAGRLNSDNDMTSKYVNDFSHWYENDYWMGCTIDFLDLFKTKSCIEFWSKVFFELSKESFLKHKGMTGNLVEQHAIIDHALWVHFSLDASF